MNNIKEDKSKLMSTSAFCKQYGVSRYKAYELFNNRIAKFPCIKIGSRYYVYRDQVDEWFNSNRGKEF